MEEKIKRLHKRRTKDEEDVRGERGSGRGDEGKI
jgi:hypothetical protein